MILFAVRASQKQSLAIQLEWAMLHKLKRAAAETFVHDHSSVRARHLDLTAIKRRVTRRPEFRAIERMSRDFQLSIPGHEAPVRRSDERTFWIENPDQEVHLIADQNRVVQSCLDRDLGGCRA